jgi:hypothetical protein
MMLGRENKESLVASEHQISCQSDLIEKITVQAQLIFISGFGPQLK